ncbi:MAG: AMIN domain-containing protein, partial [Nitrospiria bacterium]
MIGQTIRLATIILFSTFTLSCAVKTSPLKETPLTEIQSIDIIEGAEKTTIVVEGQEPMIYTTFRLPNPDRLVVDMAEIGLGNFNNKIVIEKGPILSILPKIGERNRVSRLEFELIGAVETDVRTEGLKLVVEAIRPPEEGAEEGEEENGFVFFQAEEPSRLPDEEAPDEEAPDEGLKEILSSLVREETPMGPAENVSDIRFDKEDGLQLIVTSDGRLDP